MKKTNNHMKHFLPDSEHVDHTIVDPGLLVLCNTFRYPHQVPDFLLPQPHIGKEYRIMELQNLMFKQPLLVLNIKLRESYSISHNAIGLYGL